MKLVVGVVGMVDGGGGGWVLLVWLMEVVVGFVVIFDEVGGGFCGYC